jgi:hypothetical protein
VTTEISVTIPEDPNGVLGSDESNAILPEIYLAIIGGTAFSLLVLSLLYCFCYKVLRNETLTVYSACLGICVVEDKWEIRSESDKGHTGDIKLLKGRCCDCCQCGFGCKDEVVEVMADPDAAKGGMLMCQPLKMERDGNGSYSMTKPPTCERQQRDLRLAKYQKLNRVKTVKLFGKKIKMLTRIDSASGHLAEELAKGDAGDFSQQSRDQADAAVGIGPGEVELQTVEIGDNRSARASTFEQENPLTVPAAQNFAGIGADHVKMTMAQN